MRVDFTSSHQELVLELVVQIRTTVGAIPGQQLRFTEQTRTRPEDQTKSVLLSCRWCCQEQVSQIIFYVLGAEYCCWYGDKEPTFVNSQISCGGDFALLAFLIQKTTEECELFFGWQKYLLEADAKNGENIGSGVDFATFFATYLWTTASAWIFIRHPKYGHVSMHNSRW